MATALALVASADILRDGDPEAIDKWYAEAYRISVKNDGLYHEETVEILNGHAAFLSQAKMIEGAEVFKLLAEVQVNKSPGTINFESVAKYYTKAGESLVLHKEYDEGFLIFRRALKWYRKGDFEEYEKLEAYGKATNI